MEHNLQALRPRISFGTESSDIVASVTQGKHTLAQPIGKFQYKLTSANLETVPAAGGLRATPTGYQSKARRSSSRTDLVVEEAFVSRFVSTLVYSPSLGKTLDFLIFTP